MKPFFEETKTSHRAILTSAEDVAANGENAEVIKSRWYDNELPMEPIIQKAKESGKDVITIESQTITQKSYEIKE